MLQPALTCIFQAMSCTGSRMEAICPALGGSHCILVACTSLLLYAGQQMQYTRRKQDAVCLNGGDFKRPVPVNTTCDCTLEDVECDYG